MLEFCWIITISYIKALFTQILIHQKAEKLSYCLDFLYNMSSFTIVYNESLSTHWISCITCNDIKKRRTQCKISKKDIIFWAKAGGADKSIFVVVSFNELTDYIAENRKYSIWDIFPAYAILCLTFLIHPYGYTIAFSTQKCRSLRLKWSNIVERRVHFI